ncbi:MAG: hypothetical protein H6719_09705 [Sandaracinaceae bacterium]|nr:hypothetical protein [Sandaracinaceae bacterium]
MLPRRSGPRPLVWLALMGGVSASCGAVGDASVERASASEPAPEPASEPAPDTAADSAPGSDSEPDRDSEPASAPTPASPPMALPGPCVAVPEEPFEILVTWMHGPTGPERVLYSLESLRDRDLDGDGVPDVLVPQPRARRPETGCPTEVAWDLYVMRGACGHHLGRIEGALHEEVEGSASNGLDDLHTRIDPMTGFGGPIDLRYAFDGSEYREVERSASESRCSYHPADCDVPSFSHPRCELRGHPRIAGLPNHEQISERFLAASREAQATCAPTGPEERCDVHPTFRPNGTIRSVSVRDCPRRRACVRAIFGAIRIDPWTGDPPVSSTSFTVPAP